MSTLKSSQMSMHEYHHACDQSGGLCAACGATADGVEPDARNYAGDACGEPQVFGVEELLMTGRLEVLS